jgi:putative GTP pyrophosphokinase
MTREQEFLDRWHEERASYHAWGNLVSRKISEVVGNLIAPVSINEFLKVAVKPRLKDDLKLVEKAFYRNKKYVQPYEQITDKVGTRFVVLLGNDIRKIENAVQQVEEWNWSKDRDYEDEQNQNPIAFDYAAVHFVVRPKIEVEFDNVRIPALTPCEVQIKTILQHAYSELTHDTIYKPQIKATPAMQRNAAKSMALLEATNDYFEKVQAQVDHALSNVRHMTASLSAIYQQAIGFDPKPSELEGLLLSAYEVGSDDLERAVTELLREKPFITEAIRRRVRESNPIFVQPSILLAYLEIARSPKSARARWPLTPQEQLPLLTDLGEGID